MSQIEKQKVLAANLVAKLLPYYKAYVVNNKKTPTLVKVSSFFGNDERIKETYEVFNALYENYSDIVTESTTAKDCEEENHYKLLKSFVEVNAWFYYTADEPIIGDSTYDFLNHELMVMEQMHPDWVDATSTTQKVGEDMDSKRENGIKVTHDVPMLSINDVFTKEEVVEWVAKVKEKYPNATFSVEFKIDGLSITLRYENGELVLAETRGNGFIGEDVTLNVLTLPDVPKHISDKRAMQLRGEIYMTHENFDRYNDMVEKIALQKGIEPKLAANPRNLAAGTLRQLDTKITKERGLNIFVFNVQSGPDEMMDNHMNGLSIVDKLGIPTVQRYECSTIEEILAAIDKISELRDTLPYDIDGAVVKLVQTEYREDFTFAAKYSAGHIAYKYPPQVKETTILNIVEDVGRTGKITVKAQLEPIRLGGSNVAYVTLHNEEYIKEKGIGIGAKVNVFKSGDIIPKIEKVTVAPETIFTISSVCPVCGEPTFREDGVTDVFCINPSCPAQLVRTVSNFVSLNCMNIMGLGETLVADLINLGYVKNFADIYRLFEKKDELISKGILGKEKNTSKLLNNIEASKTKSAEKLLAAFGIRNVGQVTATSIMEEFSSIEDLSKASLQKLISIKDVGPVTAQCVVDFFSKGHNIQMLNDLIALGVNTKMAEKEILSNVLDGKTLVVTGTLPTMGRKEISELIVKHGGKVSGSVSKKTSFVIVGDDAGDKLRKAQELGIKILSEDEFLKMLN